MFIASGSYPVKILQRYGDTDWRISDMDMSSPYFDIANNGGASDTNQVSASGTSGTVTITSSESIFTAGMVGAYIKLWHKIESQTLSLSSAASDTSGAMLVGESLTILTHGKWGGTVTLQSSEDGTTWKEYRKYKSTYSDGNGDFNASESGTFTEHTYIRIVTAITDGTCTVDLTRLPYTHVGFAKITAYNSGTSVTANVTDSFGSISSTDTYALSCWCGAYGYPKCVTFFQDRLVLANNNKYPYAVWLSRSGDYYNFSTEEANGTVTDDSAIMLSLVNRKEYQIQHLCASSDLIIFTDGNEWIVSGSSTVTPSQCLAKTQSSRGCTDVIPISIGNRIIYVQRRGTTVRDFAYSFETDNYDGMDLTILAKHLTRDNPLLDVCYKQDPDSMLYFVTTDGKINCLAYVNDQKVYAWSTIDTSGSFEAVANITAGTEDTVFAVVKRTVNGSTVRYIEKFSDYPNTTNPMQYVMLDCAKAVALSSAGNTLTGLTHLIGSTVDVLANGRHLKNLIVLSDGTVSLGECTCTDAIVGLPYTTEIEQPNFEVLGRSGTQQGKKKKVSEAILRLSNSYGGYLGDSSDYVDEIRYDGSTTVTLFTGNKKMTVPNRPVGGYVDSGRIYIKTADPYPFDLSAIIRVVTMGG